MLSLCLIRIKINKNQQKTICDVGASKSEEVIMLENIATKDDIEEVLKAEKASTQKHNDSIPTEKSRANKQANAVATPLPPLYLR
jgi:hypothetical protein